MPDFTLTEEQEMLRDTARALFTKECPSSLVRAAFYDVTEDGPSAAAALYDTHLRDWAALGDGPLVDLCLFLEEAGTAVAPGPTWISTSFALPLLRAAGHADAEGVASGELAATVAMAGSAGQWEPNDEPTKWFVPHVDTTDRIVVVHPGPAITVLDAGAVDRTPIEALDRTRPLFRVEVPAGGVARSITEQQLDDAVRRATVALSAELVGVGRWLQESTVDYVKERVQFDRPVGSFQGLQWKLVDAALVQERATAAVYYAAMCVDAEAAEARAAAHVAKAAAGTAARRWSRDGLQAHGGIGYTWEHDLHLRLRRAYGGDHLLGDRDRHHDRLADLMFDGPEGDDHA